MTTNSPSPDKVFEPRKRNIILLFDHIAIVLGVVVLSAATSWNVTGPIFLAIMFSGVAVLHANVAGFIKHPCNDQCERDRDCGEEGPCDKWNRFQELAATSQQ